MGKSSAAISLAKRYIDLYSFVCPNCGRDFYKNVYAIKERVGDVPEFFIPDYVRDDTAWIQCPEHYDLDLKSGKKVKVSGCGFKFKFSERRKIKWDAAKFIAYDNKDVIDKVFSNVIYSPLICLCGWTKIFIKDKLGIRKEVISKLVGREDFEVLSYNKEKCIFEFKKPEKCIQSGISNDIYEVELEDGTNIKATGDHLFYTQRGYVKLKELTENDEILKYTKICKFCNLEFFPKKTKQLYCNTKCSVKHYNYLIKQEGDIRDKFLAWKNLEETKLKSKFYNKKYKQEHKEQVKLQKRKSYFKCIVHIKQKNKEYWQKNKERLKLQNKEWIKNNYERNRVYHNAIHKKLMQTNPVYKIKRNLRRRIKLALYDQGKIKDKSITKYIGCSVEFLKDYIGSKFKEGMSWDVYGKWHLDHIVPCASFDLTKDEECMKCFHYSNLQPLWAKDNLIKGYKNEVCKN